MGGSDASQPTQPSSQPSSQSSGSSPAPTRALGANAEGADVTTVQERLIDLGYADFSEPSGTYGPKTEAAVIAFQQAHGLEADGIVGPKTWEMLFSDNAVAKNSEAVSAEATQPPSANQDQTTSEDNPAPPDSATEPGFDTTYHLLYVNTSQDAIIEQVPDDQPQIFGRIDREENEHVAYFFADSKGEWVVFGLQTEVSDKASHLYKMQRGGAAQFVDTIYGKPALDDTGEKVAYQVSDSIKTGAPPYHTIVHTLADGSWVSLDQIGGAPHWTFDGKGVIYVQEGNLTEDAIIGGGNGLTSLPHSGPGSWSIQEGMQLVDGTTIFYGAPNDEVAPDGNNWGWYKVVDKTNPEAWIPDQGASVSAIAYDGNTILAYAATVNGGQCSGTDRIYTVLANDQAVEVVIPDSALPHHVNNLSWDPAQPANLAISTRPYLCDNGEQPAMPAIYQYTIADGGPPILIAEGWFGEFIQ